MISESQEPGQPFVVMAKPIGRRCNLNCEYCYYTGADSFHQGQMSDRLLEKFIRQYIEASEGPEVHIVWHGGEPTLAGLDFYRRVVALEKRYLPKGWECWNNLQTNGVLLDDEWAAFIAEERFDVGLSVDGAAWLHDKYRKNFGGRGSWENAVAAVRRLQARGVRPDLLCTVTSSAAGAPLAVYRALRELDTGWIQFIPIVRRDAEGRLTTDSVSAESYGRFLCAVFDEWAPRAIGRLDVQLFAEAARVWSGGKAGLCWMAPTCGRALIVEMDGGVYSCDHYGYPEYRIGNIETNRLRDLADLPVQLIFATNKRDRLNAQCRACPHLAVCNGGCPKDRFKQDLNCLCAGLRRFFSHAQPIAMQILQLARRGLSPAAIMAELRN
jgi:uncharacterized protein